MLRHACSKEEITINHKYYFQFPSLLQYIIHSIYLTMLCKCFSSIISIECQDGIFWLASCCSKMHNRISFTKYFITVYVYLPASWQGTL